MKAENLMMQPGAKPTGAAPGGKTSSLRSAVQSKTAAQSAKADKNDFGSALDNAKNAQKDVKAEPEKAPKTEAQDTKQPEAKNADAKQVDAKDTEAKDVSAVEEKVVKAAEEAAELPKNGKKEKSGKTEDSKVAEAAADIPETAGAATTLNAMLMAMAGSAQTQTPLETQPMMEMPEMDVATSESTVMPETETPVQTFPTGTLDALLPQDAAKEQQAAQNQQLMDMLSSENGAGVRITNQTLPEFSTEVQEVVIPTEGIAQQPILDEVQLSPQAQTEEPSIKMGETLLEQPEQAAAVIQNTAQTDTPVRDVRTAKTDRPDNANSLFAGVPLTVEDAVLDKMQNPRQNLGDMLNRQSQQQNRQDAALDEAMRMIGGEEKEGLREAERGESQPVAQQTQPQTTGAGVLPQGMSFAETMNASAPVEAAPVQQAQDPYNVMQQIVDQARLIRSDANTEMVIRLNPEHLGELTLRVAVTASGAINATFHTENAQVRGLLESSMIQLKQELQQQGLKVNNVDVQSGLSQDFFAQSQAGQQGYPQPQHSARNQAADRRSFENDADALTVNTAVSGAAETENAANVGDAEGVNYLV
ncbi:MAG: flagellar hook-length control protein FliK [Schwartzia sp.]|nr:flagellar hook-length control protein FliK [Schwartzia sp. (in: firmicutes)]